MASDSQDSRRKHSRSSSDDELPETSKRHKYRHHRHHHRRHRHHRHHHRHSSKKHGDEKKDEIHAESKREVEDLRGIASISADYDMEEGEIVEEESIVATDVEIAHKKFDSDVESGEFRDFEGPSEFDDSHMRGVADMVSLEANHSLPSADNNGRCGKTPKSLGSDVGDGSKKHRSPCHDGEPPLLESVVNGDSDLKSSKIESTLHTRRKSPSKGSSKHKLHRESESIQRSLDIIDMDENENGKQRNLSSYRYHMETSDRSRSASPDHTREREHSQSVLLDKHVRMRHRHERDEQLYDNGKDPDELDDERYSRISTDSRFDSNDKAKGRRERSSSQHRSSMLGSKDEHADYRDIEGEENMYKDEKRMKEQVKSRERSERDNGRNRVLEKERNCGGGRDRDRDKEPDRDRGKLREMKSDMDRDTERDRERRRDKYRGWSRDGDLDRDKRRDDTITTYKDRDTEKEWDDRLDDRDRKLEMDRGRDRHSSRERHRDRNRDVERDRIRRYYKYDDRDDGYGNRDRHRGYDESKYHRDRERRNDLGKNRASKDDSLMDNLDVNRDDDDQKDYQERVDLELAGQEEDDADRIKEQSRRLRETILQKYKAQKSQHETMPQSTKASSEEPEEQTFKNVVMTATVQANIKVKRDSQDSGAGETSFDLGKSPSNNDATAAVTSAGAGGLGEGTPKSERSNDMFCDDIFGESPAGVRKMGKGDGLPVERSGLHDNWDDPEGYYSFRFGEILDSRYEITAAHGKGVFSTVVRAKDLKAGAGDPEEVAIKIIRNNETMLKAGTEELVILKTLVGADQDDRRHCVRYLSHFKYRNHLCIVFESLHMNLREVLKKFGRNIGLKLTAVRAYAKQLFIALKHLRNCGVLHCDIKPDNMLVNDAKNVLKLCDFGNAMFAGKNEVTPYLVSRFYRAPEIILGLPYDHPMDIWSVGCCLYELYTGKVLFPGPTNNDMLRLHMELKGPFPKKMLRKGAFVEKHFDTNLNFLAIEEDPVTKKPIRRAMVNIKPKDVGTIIKGSSGEDPKMLTNFKDLLEKIFALDPEKRFTVSQALNHPFITGK